MHDDMRAGPVRAIPSPGHRAGGFRPARLPFVRLAAATACLVAVAAAGAVADDAPPPRKWTLTEGPHARKITGVLTKIADGKAHFTDTKGKPVVAILAKMPEQDRNNALIAGIGSGVVVVKVKDVFGADSGHGSGFVVHPEGFIVTNYHVIRGQGAVEVVFRDAPTPVPADCMAVDQAHDLAVLKVADLPERAGVLAAAKAVPVAGDEVWTIGHPAGLVDTVGWGNVNAVRDQTKMPPDFRAQLDLADDSVFIQTDAVINRGSSGGPLLNADGQVVGINTFIAGPQLGFAVSVKHAAPAFKAAREREKPLELPIPPGPGESATAWLCRRVAVILKPFEEEQAAAMAKMFPGPSLLALKRKYRQQLLEVAREAPESWPALQALLMMVAMSDDSPDGKRAAEEMCNLLLEHHAARPDLQGVIESIHPPSVCLEFSRKLLAASPNDEVRAAAAHAVVMSIIKEMHAEDRLLPPDTSELRKEMEAMLATIEKDFGEIEVTLSGFRGTYKDLAKNMRLPISRIVMGNRARRIKGLDNNGDTFQLSDYHGKVVLLDFFAHSTPVCKKMYPLKRKLVTDYAPKPFAVLGVHCEPSTVLEQLTKDGTVTWRCWANGPDGTVLAMWNVEVIPTCFLIDKRGVVRARLNENTPEATVKKMIDALLAE